IQIDDLKREQLRINELSMRVINNANMWGALHDDDRDRDMNLFCQEYKKGMKYYSSLCKEMTLFLDNELKEYNKPNINKQLLDKQFRERLNEIIQEHISRVGNFDKVFYQSGKSLLLNERKKLDALLKQQL
ncbi:MAG: hypothetical protein IKH11_04490, partial [Bacteroidales bacterium]|nr:hypothetical protein [Bacteroidales bacterium]